MALIAFSGATRAASEVIEKTHKEVLPRFFLTRCDVIYIGTDGTSIEQGFSNNASVKIATAAF